MAASYKRAVLIADVDNVLTVLEDVESGEVVKSGTAEVAAIEEIPQYHKIALDDLPKGSMLFKYGQLIGYAQRDIACGSWVHTHNLDSTYPEGM